jgi:TolB protein
MRRLLLAALLLGVLVVADETSKLGPFTNESDVGAPAKAGSAEFDPAKNLFTITGGGSNIWAKADQFHFVWREVTGDVKLAATIHFTGQGAPHRKAGLMIRNSLETDAPYVDAMLHGNGLLALQWRRTKGDITEGVDFALSGPVRLELERKKNVFTMSVAKEGEPLRPLGSTNVALSNPSYVGLAISAHQADAAETAHFSDVQFETPAAPLQ